MEKSNIEKLIEVITEKREEIIEMSKESYKNTMDGSCFQGWKVGVIAYTDGEISEFYRSQNTSSFAEHDGEAIAVINYTVNNEIGEVFVSKEDLTSEEQENFKKFLLAKEYIENAEDWQDELNYMRVNEFNSDITYRLDMEMLEANVDNYYQENADYQIDMTLEYLQQELENIERYC